MKRFLKKLGRSIFTMRQRSEKEIRAAILLVDAGLIVPDDSLKVIIQDVQKRFRNVKISILTYRNRKKFIENNFAGLEIIIPDSKNTKEEFPLAAHLPRLLFQRRFHFLILTSLDISLVMISLLFFRATVFLFNRWREGYVLRYRTVLDVLRGVKSADKNHRRTGRGIISSLGRIFVILSEIRETDINQRILIEDNGYIDVGYIRTAIRLTQELYMNPDIILLTFEERRRYFLDMLSDTNILTAEEAGNRYRLARQMLRLRKIKFDYVILTSLDISPIIVAILFMRTRVMLYNKWHQWWSLDIKGIREYFKIIFDFLITVPVTVYLLFSAMLILSKTRLRLFSSNLYKKE